MDDTLHNLRHDPATTRRIYRNLWIASHRDLWAKRPAWRLRLHILTRRCRLHAKPRERWSA